MLSPACDSSGLTKKGSTDGGGPSDAGTGGSSETGIGGNAGGAKTETGGIISDGGVTVSGGVTHTGGQTGPGGAADMGGVTHTGGVSRAGGTTGFGGVSNAGGTTGSAGVGSFAGVTRSGGVTATGGVTNTGGVSNSGGTTSSAGVGSSAGVTRSGGVTATGGVTNTGGVSNSGGAADSGGAGSSGGITGSGGVTATGGGPTGHFQMEELDRGVVAVVVTSGVYVGWRMFGYEYDPTASNVSYNLYRDGNKIATVTDSTNFLDAAGTASSKYAVTAVVKGAGGPPSPAVTPWPQNYLSIPIAVPMGGYISSDASPGDLDGDGQYDLVLKWDPPVTEMPASGSVFLDGYTLAGKQLWRIDLGPNIPTSVHYTQFSVYDFDGDGKAEVACKTAPGTKDGTGQYLHTGPAATDDDSAVYLNASGTVITGPEYLTVFRGETGEELATVEYPVLYGSSAWGDDNGNRANRFNGGVSFVSDTGNGKTATGRPSIIQQRGYYTRLTVSALNWRDGALTKVWTYDSGTTLGNEAFGKGNHSLMTADVDNDGAMELIPGSSTINSDGTFRCATSNGHGDALHVGMLIAGKGIQVFMPHETEGGHDCHDASTCTFNFNTSGASDNGRGVAEWVSMTSTTSASCTSGQGGSVNCADGSPGAPSAGTNFLIYWDADESREILDGTVISKAGGGGLLSATGCSASNGTKQTPTLTADLLGDWREELVLRELSGAALRVYTTTNVTTRRIYTLMHDPTYRMQVSFEQSSYNQPPHVGFHIGAGMADPPKPDIYVR
jgi:hypothetical protein